MSNNKPSGIETTKANYYIFNLHETDYLDSRSKGFKEDLRLNNSLNLVRVYGLRNCFIAYLNIPNIVFYNYLFFRNSFLIHILKSLYNFFWKAKICLVKRTFFVLKSFLGKKLIHLKK